MDQQTINTYNQLAKEYDLETADFWEKFPRTIIDKFAENTTGKILDIGSGPGRDALLLTSMGLDVVCLDASETMIELTKAKGLNSVQADFLHLPFGSETFDGVWSYTSLLHIPKVQFNQAISEIARVLKNNTCLGLGLIEGETEEYRDSAGVNLPRLFSYYTKEEVVGILKKHEFELIYYETFKPRTKNYLHFLFKKIK